MARSTTPLSQSVGPDGERDDRSIASASDTTTSSSTSSYIHPALARSGNEAAAQIGPGSSSLTPTPSEPVNEQLAHARQQIVAAATSLLDLAARLGVAVTFGQHQPEVGLQHHHHHHHHHHEAQLQRGLIGGGSGAQLLTPTPSFSVGSHSSPGSAASYLEPQPNHPITRQQDGRTVRFCMDCGLTNPHPWRTWFGDVTKRICKACHARYTYRRSRHGLQNPSPSLSGSVGSAASVAGTDTTEFDHVMDAAAAAAANAVHSVASITSNDDDHDDTALAMDDAHFDHVYVSGAGSGPGDARVDGENGLGLEAAFGGALD